MSRTPKNKTAFADSVAGREAYFQALKKAFRSDVGHEQMRALKDNYGAQLERAYTELTSPTQDLTESINRAGRFFDLCKYGIEMAGFVGEKEADLIGRGTDSLINSLNLSYVADLMDLGFANVDPQRILTQDRVDLAYSYAEISKSTAIAMRLVRSVPNFPHLKPPHNIQSRQRAMHGYCTFETSTSVM